MRYRMSIFAAVIFSLSPQNVSAKPGSVHTPTLLDGCEAAQGRDISSCYNVLIGILDGLHAGAALGLNERQKGTIIPQDEIDSALGYCIPDAVDLPQVAKITTKYLNDNPQQLHYPGSYVVRNALRDAFPC